MDPLPPRPSSADTSGPGMPHMAHSHHSPGHRPAASSTTRPPADDERMPVDIEEVSLAGLCLLVCRARGLCKYFSTLRFACNAEISQAAQMRQLAIGEGGFTMNNIC